MVVEQLSLKTVVVIFYVPLAVNPRAAAVVVTKKEFTPMPMPMTVLVNHLKLLQTQEVLY